jgi:class 3 adenylate cyclase
MSSVVDPPLAERARSALERHAWEEAWTLLSEGDRTGTLTPEELGLLADAAWWVGKLPAAIDARERAYAAATKTGQPEIAVEAAIELGRLNLLRNSNTVATAWLQRAERLLEGRDENVGHGWLAVTRSFQAAMTGHPDDGVSQAMRGEAIGRRFGDRDLEMLAMSTRGYNLLARGDVAEAMPLLDEATVAATAGELQPGVAGGVCCSTIEACAALGDWRRAGDWTEAQDRWCAREGISGFPGMCRLFRSEAKVLRGAWPEAEAEARRASTELVGFMPAAVGSALYLIGEMRMRRGDFGAAEEALRGAHAAGRDPEPAFALLRLAQGRIAEAQTAIARALDQPSRESSWAMPPDSELSRANLLPARVEIAVAAGDLATAGAAADEMAALAAKFGSAAFRAASARASAEVRLAEGEAESSVTAWREAIRGWTEIDAPYEVARARLGLGRAYLALQDVDRAVLEIEAARAVFDRLGAAPDLDAVDRVLATVDRVARTEVGSPADTRLARAFMFTDIVDSTRLAELLGDEAWSELLRWHDETIRALVAEHGGEVVKGTGDGFFLAFERTEHALDCAVAIQRRFTDQRQREGFAPAVRIGIHRGEANRRGRDYTGSAVNVAARVGAAASGAEILVSAGSLDGLDRTFRELGRREERLKGVSAPLDVVSVRWR